MNMQPETPRYVKPDGVQRILEKLLAKAQERGLL
jgi:hypothetical protein